MPNILAVLMSPAGNESAGAEWACLGHHARPGAESIGGFVIGNAGVLFGKDMGLLRGDQYRLVLFRGPHQNKLDFGIVESLQPLGDRVLHVQSDKQGKNALDLHTAFFMGRFLQELETNGSPERKTARFVVISHDGGFDALMDHVQSLG